MQLNNDIVSIYSAVADMYADAFFKELDQKPVDRKLYDLFCDQVCPNGKCLEFGCGPGEVSAYLHEKGLNIIGIDKSEAMVEVARKLSPEITFLVDDVLESRLGDGSCDGIVAPFLVVNFTDLEVERAFQEMNRLLKNGGRLLVTFHTDNDDELIVRDFLRTGKVLVFYLHSVDKIKRMLEKHGFTITETVIKEPYEGEQTTRAFVYAFKK